ncbi:hypothetical protein LR68_03600 [Anoxybacillus sp. BCO1]|nr:hypothetical protein LR68_03600 [Anoxybacillus sp. BCO1]
MADVREKIGFRERQLIMTDQNRSTFAGLVKLMKEILTLIITIEIIGAVILGVYFSVTFRHGKKRFPRLLCIGERNNERWI